jgi:hypothetical protein
VDRQRETTLFLVCLVKNFSFFFVVGQFTTLHYVKNAFNLKVRWASSLYFSRNLGWDNKVIVVCCGIVSAWHNQPLGDLLSKVTLFQKTFALASYKFTAVFIVLLALFREVFFALLPFDFFLSLMLGLLAFAFLLCLQ